MCPISAELCQRGENTGAKIKKDDETGETEKSYMRETHSRNFRLVSNCPVWFRAAAAN